MNDDVLEILKRAEQSFVLPLSAWILLLGTGMFFSFGLVNIFLADQLQGEANYFEIIIGGGIFFVLYFLLMNFMLKEWELGASVSESGEEAEDADNGRKYAEYAGDTEEDADSKDTGHSEDYTKDSQKTVVDAKAVEEDEDFDLTTEQDSTDAACQMPTNIIFLKEEGVVKKGESILLLKTKVDGTPFTHIIKDPLGIHARPAGGIVQSIKGMDCKVLIKCGDKTASATSILELMKLGAVQGSKLEISAEGKDGAKALVALKKFMDAKL